MIKVPVFESASDLILFISETISNLGINRDSKRTKRQRRGSRSEAKRREEERVCGSGLVKSHL